MILTVDIKLLPAPKEPPPWQATIALDAASTLADLHLAIQRAVRFDNDHLYDFYIARTPYSRERIRFNDEDVTGGELDSRTIESLFPLPKGRRLFYLFDFGDSWRFQISRTRHKPYAPKPGVTYPQLIAEQGERPQQYPHFEE